MKMENIHVLLPRQEVQNLRKLAKYSNKSMGGLIREAVHKAYGRASMEDKRAVIDRLFKTAEKQPLPVTDWPEMKEELLKRYE